MPELQNKSLTTGCSLVSYPGDEKVFKNLAVTPNVFGEFINSKTLEL